MLFKIRDMLTPCLKKSTSVTCFSVRSPPDNPSILLFRAFRQTLFQIFDWASDIPKLRDQPFRANGNYHFPRHLEKSKAIKGNRRTNATRNKGSGNHETSILLYNLQVEARHKRSETNRIFIFQGPEHAVTSNCFPRLPCVFPWSCF